ncbi:MAG: rhamnogalacturonan acetylesterase [Duncaniella sp.]|nr:rhamnogalacturonan acetylesterase [Duncaniella sp.]
MKILKSFLLALAMPMLASAAEPADTLTVFMIGDSTMANKPLDKENQERGWGQMLSMHLTGPVRVDNHAVNGRSSKSFLDEGRWDVVKQKIRPGDYVIIQFGHNDEKSKDPKRFTAPGSTFDENLRLYVKQARELGAIPVLMNSIARRNFPAGQEDLASESDDHQKEWNVGLSEMPREGKTLVDTHGAYLDSPRKVAEETGATFIDLNALTMDLVQQMGPEFSKNIYMWIPADTYEFCPKGKVDNTHLNVLGAIIVSKLAAVELARNVEGLRPYVRPEVYNLNAK